MNTITENTITDNIITVLSPEQDEQQVFARITSMYKDRRLAPGALSALLTTLEKQPHVTTDKTADERLTNNEDRYIADSMLETAESVHLEARKKHSRTVHERSRSANFEVDFSRRTSRLIFLSLV